MPQWLDLTNSALLHDELLLDISRVLEGSWPVGPSFVHSLGTLAEAVVIHDRVYFDPLRRTEGENRPSDKMEGRLAQSPFIQELLREGALSLFPKEDEIDTELAVKGVEYRHINFLDQSTWTGASFMWADPSSEVSTYRNLLDLVRDAPRVLAATGLVKFQGDWGFSMEDVSAMQATALGFNEEDLRTIESWNRRAAAYVELCGHLGIHLYPLFSALPHQLGAVGAQHTQVRTIYETVVERVVGDEQIPVGESGFSRIPIPPLAQITMAQCKGSPAALAHELLALRERHRRFRQYLTDFERDWNFAETRADRQKLRKEFKGAWETLLTREDRPRAGMVSRIIGFVWDVVKTVSPAGVGDHTAGGDKIITSMRERSIIRRVGGLHDFYQELAHSPVSEHNRRYVASLFPEIAKDPVWDAAAELADATNTAFILRDPYYAVQEPTSGG